MLTTKIPSRAGMAHAVRATRLVAALGLATVPAMQAAAQARTASLQAGTVIPVRLNTGLSSKDNTKGDPFTATVRADDGGSYAGLPEGSKVEGTVYMARPQRGNQPGELDLDFRRLVLPDGRTYAMRGSLIGLDNKSVRRASDGRMIATPDHRDKRLLYAGYGAGAGLIIGALSKHTLEDTLLGGGLGYLYGALQKGGTNARDVVLKPGTELGVRLDRSVVLSDYSDDRSARADSTRYHRSSRGADGLAAGAVVDRSRPVMGDLSGRDADALGVMVDDRDVTFASNAMPLRSRGVVLVPLRPVMDAAGIPYTYDPVTRQIRTSNSRGNVRVALNSAIAVEGGRRVRLAAPARMLNGTVYVPMQFFGMLTGYPTDYDSGSATVIVHTHGDTGVGQ